ncbi:MAG: pseudouridine synthase [Hyphococcus sp.]|nr:MAG: pseudouridine synthase [Marinicaulis sp.]
MSGVQTKVVTADEADMRLDRWFKAHFPAVTHGMLEKYLRKGQVRVAGGRVKANRRLVEGEEIRIPPMQPSDGEQRKPKTNPHTAQDKKEIEQLILYQDDAIIALNKPFGLAVQGGANMKRHVDGMLGALEKNGERPKLVHRLDKDTGGLLLVAKTRKAAQKLSDAFRGHEIEKTYWALTASVPIPAEGTISLPIAKRMVRVQDGAQERVVPFTGEAAKNAVTDYQIVEDATRVAFVAMRPVTGRTHQLRVHSAAMGCPIVGDGKYGGEAAHIEGVSSKLHLFCRAMTFAHPVTGRKMTLQAPITGHMKETWKFFSFDQKANCDWPEDLRR